MFKRTAIAALLAAVLLAAPALAQDERVLATVDGTEITAADVEFAYENFFADQLSEIPPEQARDRVLEILVDLHLLADAAREAGLGETPQFERRVELIRRQALRDVYFAERVASAVTDETVQERYEEVFADYPLEEVSASHILVESEEEAREILAELEAGADFATLAEERSIDPGSAQRGGSLGWFPRGRMVPAFEEAAFSLEPGEVTEEPVQTQFGWHIVRVDDTRMQEAPPVDEVADAIRERLFLEAYREEVDRLRSEATIERPAQTDDAQ